MKTDLSELRLFGNITTQMSNEGRKINLWQS